MKKNVQDGSVYDFSMILSLFLAPNSQILICTNITHFIKLSAVKYCFIITSSNNFILLGGIL